MDNLRQCCRIRLDRTGKRIAAQGAEAYVACLELFARLQYEALQVSATAARAKLVEDYTLLFKVSSLEELRAVALGRFEATLYDTISPQVQIAENLGFVTGWRY